MFKVKSLFFFIMITTVILQNCSEEPIHKALDSLYGTWFLERIDYTNTSTFYSTNSSYQEYYHLKDEIRSITNNLSSYLLIFEIFSNNTKYYFTNFWYAEVEKNFLHLTIQSNRYVYQFTMVAKNSKIVNYLWLNNGFYLDTSSNTNNFFFSNNIETITLRKLQN